MPEKSACPEVYLTGFGEFDNVNDNPTTHLINHFKENGVPDVVCAMKILHVSVEKGGNELEMLHEQCRQSSSGDTQQILLHLGVNMSAMTFLLEQRAQNLLNFKRPDQCGKIADNEAICSEKEGSLYCQLPLEKICKELKETFGDQVSLSNDAGLFICNYVYFKTLQLCEEEEEKNSCKRYGLFLHVPSFETISFMRQVEFVQTLIRILVSVVQNL